MENNNSDIDDSGFFEEKVEIDNSPSKLSSTPGKNILIILILLLLSMFFLYKFVFKEDDETKEKKRIQRIVDSQPQENAVEPIRDSYQDEQIEVGEVLIPEIPEIDEINVEEPKFSQDELFESNNLNFPSGTRAPLAFPEEEPVELPALLPIQQPRQNQRIDSFGVPFQSPPISSNSNQQIVSLPETYIQKNNTDTIELIDEIELDYQTDEETLVKKQRIRVGNMILRGGSGNPPSPGRSSNQLNTTSAQTITATKIANTNITIAQGKVIDAVLETAISTDLEGNLRAIVSRDIYAESGRNILIPKGSRLVGDYGNFNPTVGQERIDISWSRIIRPDGVDIAINAQGTDGLGRAGIKAFVDNKYYEIFSNSLLLSVLTVGGAVAIEKISESSGTSSTETNNAGGTSNTQTGSASDFAILDSVDSLTDTASDIIDSY